MALIELFDETLDINSTGNYELILQVSRDDFCYLIFDTLRNKIVFFKAFVEDNNKYLNASGVKDIIDSEKFLLKRYSKVKLIMPSSKFTVVPATLYDPAKKDEYFLLNYRQEPEEIILSNRIKDPDAYIVFSVSGAMIDILRGYYDSIYPLHHSMPLLEHISRARKSTEGPFTHAHIERDYLNLILFRDNQLLFCNTYNYRNVSDILFYILNVFKKLNINQEETIHLSGMIEKFDDLHSSLSMYVRTIKFAEPKGNFIYSYVLNDMELHRYLNLFNALNCG
jgi:hypothetical protein